MGMAKPGSVLSPKRGAVVSQLVPKLKESVPPPPLGGSSRAVTVYLGGDGSAGLITPDTHLSPVPHARGRFPILTLYWIPDPGF